MKEKRFRIIWIAILFSLQLFVANVQAQGVELEAGVQIILQESRRLIGAMTDKFETGEPVVVESDRLLVLAEELRISTLLIGERFEANSERLAAVDGSALLRQQMMAERYQKLITEFLVKVTALPPAAILSKVDLLPLQTFLDQILPRKSLPLLGSLPYQQVNYPVRTFALTPMIRPAYQGGADLMVKPADTAGVVDGAIVALAASLDWSPVAIYEWVLNNIESEWYWGAMKGAAETLRQRSGNDADQAELLVALLRAANFPSRYVRGKIEFFPNMDQAARLIGLDDPLKIATFLQKAGIPFEPVISGGRIVNFRIEHLWVETFVPYANYRGVVLDEQGKLWIPLDTHLKPAGYDWRAGSEFPGDFPLSRIRDDYLAVPHAATPLEYLWERLGAAGALEGEEGRRTLIAQHLGILPANLQFTPVGITGEFTDLPGELQHTVTFVAADPAGQELFTLSVDAARLASRELILSFEPETVADQQVIDSFGGLDNTPAYLVRLRPVLLLDRERLVVARDGLAMGSDYILTLTLNSPGGTEQFSARHIVGNLAAVAIVCQKAVLPDEEPVTEKDAARLLFEEAIRYIDRWNASEESFAALLDLSLIRPLPTIVTVGSVLQVDSILDTPHAITWKGLFIDAGLRRVEVVAPVGQEGRERELMRLSALEGSVLESRLFTDDFGVAAVSTSQLLASATSASLIHIDPTNIDALLPSLGLAENVRDDIVNAVHQGLHITIPAQEGTYHNWTGIGYLKENPVTGEAGYMLSGMIAGGMTVEAWAADYRRDLLQSPFSAPPNRDPLAAAHIARIAVGDQQNGIVGKAVKAPLAVLVTDVKGRPVVGAAVTFTVLAGNGSFADRQDVTVQTAANGIASVRPILGIRTADNPSFQRISGTDAFATQVGVNLFTAAVTGQLGELSLAQPFTAYGRPDRPQKVVALFGNGHSALVNTPVGSLLVKTVDQHGNPVSNLDVTFSVQETLSLSPTVPLPELYRKLEFYLRENCTQAFPLAGECVTAPSLTQTTGPYGAGVEALMGNTVNTRYQIIASAPDLEPAHFVLSTLGMMTEDGGYLAQLFMAHLTTVNEQGTVVNAAKVGTPLASPLSTAMFLLSNDYSMQADGSGGWRLTGSATINSRRIIDGKVSFTSVAGGGTSGPVQLGNGGNYQANYTLGLQPLLNVIASSGEATLTVPEVYADTQLGTTTREGYAGAILPLRTVTVQTGQKLLFDRTSGELLPASPQQEFYEIYGVDLPARLAPPVTILGDGGLTKGDLVISYTIQPQGDNPAGYQALSAGVDLYSVGPDRSKSWLGYLPGNAVAGIGNGIFNHGTVFDPTRNYAVQTVLNRGSSIEIRGDLLPLPLLRVDLDIDSDNNAGITSDGMARDPSRNPVEEQVEDLAGFPGKVISPNFRDVDNDGVPGFADGIDLQGNGGAGASDSFTPLLLELGGSALDPVQATVRFDYPGSDPALVQKSAIDGIDVYSPAPGSLRLWTKDGRESRNPAGVENGGDYVQAGKDYTLSQLGSRQTDGSWKFYVEGLTVSNGTGDQRIVVIIDPDGGGTLAAIEGDAVRTTSPLIGMIADYNHNQEIDEEDRQRAARGDTYYFWINDDDDSGETGGTDIPLPLSSAGSSNSPRDADNNIVDGVRDLIDFFPVALDVKSLVGVFPTNIYQYQLKSEAENLKVVFPELTVATVKNYLVDVPTARRLAAKESRTIRDDGIAPLTNEESITRGPQQLFSALIRSTSTQETPPVILIEGIKPGQAPLVLEIVDAAGNQVITTKLNLSLDGVEQMFRHVNLIAAAGGPPAETGGVIGEHKVEGGEKSRTGEPINFPDSETESKYLVMLHGFNNNGQVARGWHAEMFKRFYWMGSRTRFVGVSWYGFENVPDYQQNVANAFETAQVFGSKIKSVSQGMPVVIMAHSLGNMVVSGYIADQFANQPVTERPLITDYFMVNAAVALESYLGDYQGYAEGKGNEIFGPENPMVHPAWYDYQKRLGASEWYHQFIETNDPRSILTWRNRFANINRQGINLYSFYSQGEDVLGTHEGDPGLFEAVGDALLHDARHSWAFQEKWKGRAPIDGYGGTTLMGWGINSAYMAILMSGDKTMADAIENSRLITEPFFLKPQVSELGGELFENTVSLGYVALHRDELLAMGIPALTLPAGGIQGGDMIFRSFLSSDRLFNINGVLFKNGNNWPTERGEDKNWKHSDLKKVALPFGYKAFTKIINLIDLEQ